MTRPRSPSWRDLSGAEDIDVSANLGQSGHDPGTRAAGKSWLLSRQISGVTEGGRADQDAGRRAGCWDAPATEQQVGTAEQLDLLVAFGARAEERRE